MQVVAASMKTKLPDDLFVDSQVGIGPVEKGFGIKVGMRVVLPDLVADMANTIVEKAHHVCPYSNATRGNVEVNFTVVVD